MDISKFPVVVVANYRTGSSSLSKYLAARYNLDLISEPFHNPYRCAKLQQHHTNNTPYVAKFIVDQLALLDIHQQVLDSDCFKIRLVRNDLVQQVVSYYIATQRRRWQQTIPAIAEHSVPLDQSRMQVLSSIIQHNNLLLKNLDIKFDLELQYENLDFNRLQQSNYKTTPPINIDAIVDLANQVIHG